MNHGEAVGERLTSYDNCSAGVSPAEQAFETIANGAASADFDDGVQRVFIVGAPRCGTTSLSGYLSSHPDVCFANVKEPHYFAANDLRGLADDHLRRKVQQEYLARYFPRTEGFRVLAEGSVTYLYTPEQLTPILRLWPNSKFVVGVRNPLTLVPSLHQRLCFNGDDTVRDFERAWELVPERRQGRSVPRSCAHARWLDYWGAGMLGEYVERLFASVGPARCFVYLFDDLAADPGRVYREVLDFLSLPDDGRQFYPTHRPSRDYRIGWLQRVLKRPPRSLASLGGERYRRILEDGATSESGPVAKFLWAARDRILELNRKPAPPLHIPHRLRAEMIDMYRDDIARLGALLGRDLDHWLGDVDGSVGMTAAPSPHASSAAGSFTSVQSAGFP